MRREHYQEAAKEFLEANNKIARYFDLPGVYVPDVNEVVARWESDLRADFRVLPPDAEDALESLNREATRTPPARGGRGARDSLIWLTCRRLAADGNDVLFVSRNTKDFADPGGKSLHPALSAELAAGDTVNYLVGLDGLFDLLANKVEGPDVSDAEPLMKLLGFELWDIAVDLFEAPAGGAAGPPDVSLELSDLKNLRAYAVDDKGLALVSGCACAETVKDDPSIAIRFMAWVEFDIDEKIPLQAELVTADVAELV